MGHVIKALSVDDEKTNLLLIEAMSRELGIHVTSFLSPLEALDYVKDNEVDLVFVDYMMPGIDGIEFIRRLKQIISDIHIVMITSVNDDSTLKVNAISAGATEFLNKPLNIAEFKARVSNLTELRRASLLLKDRAKLLEFEVRAATQEIRTREYETLSVLARAAEYRDRDTGAHIVRVGHYARIMAAAIGESEKTQDLLFNAAPLHDVGKIGVPDSILLKPGPLTDEETGIMKTHPLIGYEILRDSKSEYLQAGALVSLAHHEKFDGTGYPYGLKGDAIHLFGRIVAIADVFDALSTRRPYKEPWPIEVILEHLRNSSGTHFDPVLLDHFFRNFPRIRKIREEITD